MLHSSRIRYVFVGLLVAMLAASFVWRWLPHYRPGLDAGESYGVDVSRHQGEINWMDVANDNIDFAYIKASEGGDFVDVFFGQNWREARTAGLDVGAYHFFTLCRSGQEQAENFLTAVPIEDATLPAALDLETGGNCSQRPDQAWVEREVGIFIELVEEATGEEVLLYIGEHIDALYGVTDTFAQATWQRKLFRRPGDERWTFWQFSYLAKVSGIDGGVDLNVRRPSEQ